MASRIKKVKGEESKSVQEATPASFISSDEIKRKAATLRGNRENTNDAYGRPMNPEDIIDQKIKKAAELRPLSKEERLRLAHISELQSE